MPTSDLWGYEYVSSDAAETWRPSTLTHAQWPPDYRAVYAWRLKQREWMRETPGALEGAKRYYADPAHAAEFIQDWMDTYDPRQEGMKWLPFVFFQRQEEFIDFLNALIADQESGLVEKCRDVGLTWLCCAWAVWAWLFVPAFAIGFGSRKEEYVDKLGVLDSIFEKIRRLLRRIPREFLPEKFDPKIHSTYMRLLNPDNEATITGEAGTNIGRGGRKSIYFKDESAHYEQPESIEAALGDNTNVQVDISSVNGLNNPFHRRREAGVDWPNIEKGKTRVFVVDWRDHPTKTQEWFETRRAKAVAEGMLHKFAQEVERDYSGAVENTIIELPWIKSAIGADEVLRTKYPDTYGKADFYSGPFMGAFDPADDGGDRNAFAMRKGVVLTSAQDWGGLRDVGVSTRKTVDALLPFGPIECQYDVIGVGSGVKSEYNRLVADGVLTDHMVQFVPWNASGFMGSATLDPYKRFVENDEESAYNKDLFGNIKAQAWWNVRLRFWKTFQAVTMGIYYDPAELIVLHRALPLIRQIEKELAQPVRTKNGAMKMIVDKKPEGAKSPNLADAIVMCYFPMPSDMATMMFGSFSSAA